MLKTLKVADKRSKAHHSFLDPFHFYGKYTVVCCNGLQGLKMDWNLGEQQATEHTATRYVQDWFRSDNES